MKETMSKVRGKRRIGSVLCLILAIAATASADMIWVGYGDDIWDGSLNNWYDTDTGNLATHFPTASTNVPMPMPVCKIGATTNAQANMLWIGPWGGNPGSLTMNGGSLSVSDYIFVGSQANASFTVNGGAINVQNQILLGANGGTQGFMTMNGGSITIINETPGAPGYPGLFIGGNGYGQLDIYGGQILTTTIGFGVWGAGSGVINFHNGGKIIIRGLSQLEDVEYWMADGEINGATLRIEEGNIVLVPEPVTCVLWAIGSLIALRQKR